jgi:hypothetical protein
MLKILYLYIADELNKYSIMLLNILTKELKIRYELEIQSDSESLNIVNWSRKKSSYDLILVQNSQCLIQFQSLLKILKNIPVVFVSYSFDIKGYMVPIDNLYSVFNFGEANLESWGIPHEMQVLLNIPVLGKNNYYQKKNNLKVYQILFYPTHNTVHTSLYTLVSILKQFSNVVLTIVGDTYQVLSPSFPNNLTIITREAAPLALKKAHIVIASERDAIQAMAWAKPCIIMGDYGLGGIVTPDNYEVLKNYSFKGRWKASFNEYIPCELLNYEIQKALSLDNQDNIQRIQKRVLKDYSYEAFSKAIRENLNHIISLSKDLKKKTTLLQLKPLRTSILSIEKIKEVVYLKKGKEYYCEVDEEFQYALEQCNGTITIQDILSRSRYASEDKQIFIKNLLELWKKKMIVFT